MQQYKNILVNALINLGDVVVSTGAIKLLRIAYPDARITLLCKGVVRQAVENNPVIDEVIVFDYKANKNSISGMLDMVKLLKSRKFDLSISFDRKFRPAILCMLAGIPVRVGPDKIFEDKPSKVTWLYTHVVKLPADFETTIQAENYQAIVRGFTGLDIHEKPVFARITDSNHKKADELLKRLPRTDKVIGLCVKGTFGLKTWPKEYFAQVVNALNEKYNAAFFVVGAPNDRDYSDEVIKEINLPIENFCGDTSLTDLAALISKVDLFLTVDTGATHIAATTGVKMVTVYGCTTPKRWHPVNDNAVVMSHDPECCPCSYGENDCPYAPKPKCLWEVTPEMVLEACVLLME